VLTQPRIYLVISTFYPLFGGAETQTLALGKRLQERGCAVTILTFRHEKAWMANESIEGVPLVRIAGLLLGKRKRLPKLLQKLCYLLALVQLGWSLWRRRSNYDVLHVQQLSLLALPAILVCRITGRPLVVAVRSAGPGQQATALNKAPSLVRHLGTTVSLLLASSAKRQNGDLEDLERLGRPVVRLTRELLERIGAVVVVLSSRMKDYLFEHGLHLSRVQLIPNGVDTRRFQPREADTALLERDRVVVCVSRLSREKGIDILLKAWQFVYESLPQAKLIIVGHGPLREELESLALALKITESVEFAGFQDDIPTQLNRGDIAVLPSLWEGLPNALLEAMACGLPCVATRVSGSEDIIQHEITGLLVEPQEIREMAEALLTLLQNPQLARTYGQAARRRVERYYSLEHITELYIQLYKSMVSERQQFASQYPHSSPI
jgi:glycosyltransferase involved in cell wall biosynthesis